MKELNEMELTEINGGEITVDLNKLVDQINPLNLFYDFGYEVVYPKIYKPAKSFLKKIFS